MSKKKGRKLIQILRELTEGPMTINGFVRRTTYSISEAKKLVSYGIEEQFIEKCKGKGGIRRRPGKPRKKEFEKQTGRPSDYYHLSKDGEILIRFDPVVRDRWKDVEKIYADALDHDEFDSYYDLVDAIRRHPQLRRYQKTGSFMEDELQLAPLSPFVFGNEHGIRETTLYDTLIETMKANVRPEHILNYYLALERHLPDSEAILASHELLLKRMQAIPEVQEYLKKHSQP
jgi:hypothetical protein